jgi:hypothetical protein
MRLQAGVIFESPSANEKQSRGVVAMSESNSKKQKAGVVQYQVLAVSPSVEDRERVLKEFTSLPEAQAFVRFLEKGGAFAKIRIEPVQHSPSVSKDQPLLVDRPSRMIKWLYLICMVTALTFSIAVGLVLGRRIYSALGIAALVFLPFAMLLNKVFGER